MLRFSRLAKVHTQFFEKAFFSAAKKADCKIVCISGLQPTFDVFMSPPFLRRYFLIIAKHISKGLQILKSSDVDIKIVTEYNTSFLLIVFLFSCFRSKNVYFLVHHNFQQSIRNRISWLFHFLALKIDYKFILFETHSVLEKLNFDHLQSKFVLVDQPVPSPNSIRMKDCSGVPIVGIVGTYRSEKRYEIILSRLLEIKNTSKYDFKLLLGTNEFSAFNNKQFESVRKINTVNEKDYFLALSMCDILVVYHEKERYFYRTSGVIADAIGSGTFIICPDYPLFRRQITYPKKVGEIFKTLDELSIILEKVITKGKYLCSGDFELHRTIRSVKRLTEVLNISFCR